MHLSTTAIAAAGFVAHSALAFGDGSYGGFWGVPGSFSTPDNTNNDCTPAQSGGYDWSGLSEGPFSSYGSNQFSGWSCANSFGKRDLLSKRTFQPKCITAGLDQEPSISCDDDNTMSLDQFQVSADQDADLECHYAMPDGSICKEYHSCSAEGSLIQNSQCGGARSVTFKPAGDSKGKGCNIGVHSVGFNCGSPSSTVPAYPSATPTYTTSVSIPIQGTGSIQSYNSSYITQPAAPVYSVPSSPGIPSYISTSSTEGSPVQTSSIPIYGTGSVPSYNSSYSIPAQTGAVTTGYYPRPQSPNVLPKCLNTWMHLVSCKDNTDYSCFCKNKDFVSQVYGCLSSWSQSDDDTTSGASYFMGMCAQYVPQNPAVITACPSTVTPAATFTYVPMSSTQGSPVESSVTVYSPATVTIYSTKVDTVTSCAPDVTNCPARTQVTSYPVITTISAPPAPVYSSPGSPINSAPAYSSPIQGAPVPTLPASVPVTVMTYSTQYRVPVTYPNGQSQGSTIPLSSSMISFCTTVTVPQVQIITYTATHGSARVEQPGLGYGTPVTPVGAVPAASTPVAPGYAAPYPTTSVPGPVGPVAGPSSGLGTTYVPGPSTTFTPYTGGAAKMSISGLTIVAIAGFLLI